jgi:hypothetical protein
LLGVHLCDSNHRCHPAYVLFSYLNPDLVAALPRQHVQITSLLQLGCATPQH